MRDEAETVACGRGRTDAPARGCGTRFQHLRRPQQKERQSGIGGGEMQPLTRFQVELVNGTGDGGYRARTQRLLDRPQRVSAMRRLH